MTLAHTNTNGWADSSGDLRDKLVQRHNVLDDLGKQVIREMNRLGMIVAISHVADKTSWDALEVCKARRSLRRTRRAGRCAMCRGI
jgi:membrane dipeptidase